MDRVVRILYIGLDENGGSEAEDVLPRLDRDEYGWNSMVKQWCICGGMDL